MPTAYTSTSGTALIVPPTQNTAPVIEYNCLYTHDLRRKTKRWQDGFLRLHTFNKRVMVYDVPRNLVGDMHLTGGGTLCEGDEIRLDKGGVLVQVADKVGQTETDLTGVLKIKNPATSSSPLRPLEPTRPNRQPLIEKHRSLNALLGEHRAPIGKVSLPGNGAFIAKSPFEIRREQQEPEFAQPPAKRRKVAEHDRGNGKGSKHNATSCKPHKQAESTAKAKATASKSQQAQQTEPIDLCSDDIDENVFSSMLVTPPSVRQKTMRAPAQAHNVDDTTAPSRDTRRLATRLEHKASINHTPQLIESSKRLQIAKPSAKRNSLACITKDVEDIDTRQSRQLAERVARLPQHSRSLSKPSTIRNSPSHEPTRQAPKLAETKQRDVAETPADAYDLDLDEDDLVAALSDKPVEAPSALEPATPSKIKDSNDTGMLEDVGWTTRNEIRRENAEDSNELDQAFAELSQAMDVCGTETAKDDFVIFEDNVDLDADVAGDADTLEDQPLKAAPLSVGLSFIADGDPLPIVTRETANQGGDLQGKTNDTLEQTAAQNSRGPSVVWSGAQADDPNREHSVSKAVLKLTNAMVAPSNDPSTNPKIDEVPQMSPTFVSIPRYDNIEREPQTNQASPIDPPTTKQRRRRHGIGRMAVRESASACFKPPKLSTRPSTTASVEDAPATETPPLLPHTSTFSSGAWSREAFDLMVWRPPGWTDERWDCSA